MKNNITAIIVTFHPDVVHLIKTLHALSSQVQHIIVINNGPIFDVKKVDDIIIEVINLNENMGIGYATNIGLKIALERGSSHILICDQDTLFPIDYVEKLLEAMPTEFSVLVPNYYDTISNKNAKRFAIKKYQEFSSASSKDIIPVTQAIASGMLIKKNVLNEGFLFNEELFMDWVDFEWCWRLRKAGLKIAMRTDILLEHQLGSYSRTIFQKSVNIRSADRHYYITRNAVYLSLYCPSLRFSTRIKLFIKALIFLFIYPLLAKPFSTHGHATALGFLHGFLARLGPIKRNFNN